MIQGTQENGFAAKALSYKQTKIDHYSATLSEINQERHANSTKQIQENCHRN